MAILTLGELKKFIDTLPDDYEICYKDETTTKPISSNIEIDLDSKELIFK